MTSLSGIFNNGVSGMLAFSSAMSGISGNIANLTTIGYKRVDTQFATLLGSPIGLNSALVQAPVPNRQNGVASYTRGLVGLQGAIMTTGAPTDLAINGAGFFVFGNGASGSGAQVSYSRAGSLMTIVNGTASYLANQSGQYLLGMPVSSGAASVPGSAAQLVPIQVSDQAPFPGRATTAAALAAVIPAAGAATVSTPITYDDANGTPQSLTLTWSNPSIVPGGGVSWDVTVTDATGVPVGGAPLATMRFDNDGQALMPSLTIPAGGASFTLEVSKVQMLGDATSGTNGSSLAVNSNYIQDGLPAGAFTGIEIDADGTVTGLYDGGAKQPLYRIPLATFASPDNLTALNGNMYQPSNASGAPLFGWPDSGPGSLYVGGLESSNVDLGSSFSQLILTQTAYNAAAQVVRIADNMSATARDLKR